jgi:ABC-type phosphate transport system substrate-binding protein
MKSHTMFRRVALLALALPCAAAQAGEIIAHASVTLTADEVKEVFLGDKQLAGSVKLIPVDNASQQADFTGKVLQSDVAKYTARWTKKAFREGLTAPAVKGSDAEVIAFVKSTPGAVGYVGAPSSGVKVLQKY